MQSINAQTDIRTPCWHTIINHSINQAQAVSRMPTEKDIRTYLHTLGVAKFVICYLCCILLYFAKVPVSACQTLIYSHSRPSVHANICKKVSYVRS